MKNRIVCLLLALLIVVSGMFTITTTAYAANTQRVDIGWNWYETGKGFYNPQDKGKDITIYYFLMFSGKNSDGTVEKGLYAQRKYVGKIGENKIINESCDSITDYRNKVYTECKIYGAYLPITEYNYNYTMSSGESNGEITIRFVQDMNTETTAKIAPGSKILDSDLNDMPIRFTIAKIDKDGEQYPFKNIKNRKVIENTLNFKPGKMHVWNDRGSNIGFNRAIFGDVLGIFSPYTGKYKTFELRAEFAGARKAELESRYNLKLEGDDIKGWTLTLSSKPAKKYPMTGDVSNIALFVVLLVVSTIGIVLVSSRKKKFN